MKLPLILPFSLICFLLVSCDNGELSKNQAKQQILEKIKFPYIDSTSWYIAHSDRESALSAGLIQLRDCECYYKQCPELTPEGKKYLIRSVSQSAPCEDYLIVKTADVDFGEISDILILNESNSAEVFYTINQKFTPFEKLLRNKHAKDTLVERRAIFTKSKDGWKIDNAQLRSHPR